MSAERLEMHPEFDPDALAPELSEGFGRIDVKLSEEHGKLLASNGLEDSLLEPARSSLEAQVRGVPVLMKRLEDNTSRVFAKIWANGEITLTVATGAAALAALAAWEIKKREGKDVRKAIDYGRDIVEILPNFLHSRSNNPQK